jgi:hypothetical protein
MERTAEAVGRVHHCWELDPLNSVINASVGMIRYLGRDYDGALVALRRGLEIDPTHFVSHLRVGLVCLQKNLLNEAINAMQQAVMHSGGSTETLVGLAQAHGVAGDKLAMTRIVQDLAESGHRYVHRTTSRERMRRSATSNAPSNGWREPTRNTTRILSS